MRQCKHTEVIQTQRTETAVDRCGLAIYCFLLNPKQSQTHTSRDAVVQQCQVHWSHARALHLCLEGRQFYPWCHRAHSFLLHVDIVLAERHFPTLPRRQHTHPRACSNQLLCMHTSLCSHVHNTLAHVNAATTKQTMHNIPCMHPHT